MKELLKLKYIEAVVTSGVVFLSCTILFCCLLCLFNYTRSFVHLGCAAIVIAVEYWCIHKSDVKLNDLKGQIKRSLYDKKENEENE